MYTTAIERVLAAAARRSIQEWMTNLFATGDHIVATNGHVTAAHPFATERQFVAHAESLMKAFKTLGDGAKIEFDENSMLKLSSGRKRISIGLLPVNAFSYSIPQGEWEPLPGEFRSIVKSCAPYISEDISRPWSCGVAFLQKEDIAFSTNNFVTYAHKFESFCPDFILPVHAIEYILDRDVGPTHFQLTGSTFAVQYADKSWMNSALFGECEPFIELIKNGLLPKVKPIEQTLLVDENLKRAAKDAAKFADGTIEIKDGKIFAGRHPTSYEEDIDYHTDMETAWSVKYLSAILDVCTHIDLNAWPDNASWHGNGCSGILAARRFTENG